MPDLSSDSVSLVQPPATVFLGMPHCGPIHLGAAKGLYRAEGNLAIMVVGSELSILCHNFNALWSMALNERVRQPIDYFAMLHSDIMPLANDWLQVLIDELRRTGSDVMSAVVPIKTDEGFTSTAIDVDPEDESADLFAIERKLTMREVASLPETFGAADCGYPDRRLLVNSGCWVADFRKPWVEDVSFDTFTEIGRTEEGLFEPKAMSEDWLFSRFVQRRGGKVMATRKVPLLHFGTARYPNTHAWGTAATDEGKPALVLPERKAVA